MQAAVPPLRELQLEHRRLLPPAPLLRFRGLATFQGRVLYADPGPSPELVGLAHTLERGFARKGLSVVKLQGHDCFHLTVAKIPAGRKPRPSLPLELPPAEKLGTQAVESLCLCQMCLWGFFGALSKAGQKAQKRGEKRKRKLRQR
nr:leukocyte receptor cluster member 9-like isoform X1 [Pelodiscus sinensis]XP_014432274.1 leukocyte receptor cluster member 9-like isoform X2 [Pelodiscus sinensis]|eukprot:XP_014432273.1 leukocyte receptor cluster member 9-like isoform X1 [Pelodiscus sinensis]